MFLLYHSKGCNIFEMVPHECYVNDLHTTTCSGMLGHHTAGRPQRRASTRHIGKTTAVCGGSSAGVSKPMKTKIVAARGSHPSKRGKGITIGPTDVEKE
jgi:hypothetical protein